MTSRIAPRRRRIQAKLGAGKRFRILKFRFPTWVVTSISIPPEAIGGRLFGGLRPCFCSARFSICLLFELNPYRRGIAILNSESRCVEIINSWRPRTEEFRPSGVVEPAGGMSPQSILTCASYRGLWIGGGCGLVLGHSALAAVAFYPIVGSH